MKKFLILAALTSTVIFAGCERKETVVVPSTETPMSTPGPKGDTGAMGPSGSTTVIVPPAATPMPAEPAPATPAAPAEAPK
ncbi:hypothetical protein [Actimicrobium antarcticum]|uniref:Collagen-like protein n=1 Tax=Actimicrobium antarcticum TaxID=1051899 RepID=A0ABP7SGX1_9BURK